MIIKEKHGKYSISRYCPEIAPETALSLEINLPVAPITVRFVLGGATAA